MKSTTTATAAYESPNCRVIEIGSRELICTSPEQPTGLGGFDGWED